MRRGVLAAFALLVLVGCGGPPKFSVDLDRNGRTVTLQVVDETGLVTGVTSGAQEVPDLGRQSPVAWHPRGRLTELGVAWYSGICTEHPVLRLAGNALELTIDEGIFNGVCADMAVPNAVTLQLNSVVDAAAINVRMITH